MKAFERFLEYVKINTKSDEDSTTCPSTKIQFDLAYFLEKEMKKIGISEVRVDDNCYVYGVIPATSGYESKKAIGFISHMDTAPDFSGENVKPQILENYNGEDVVLGNSGRVLSVEQFPHLKKYKGYTLITTDGTTLLGADDKAGIAEILTACETIINNNIPHGKICIGFTPDEEIGSGADHFDIKGFGADFAYTVDGGAEGEIEYENFNAGEATFVINGFNIHPGEAKDKMINASIVAMEINGMLPNAETPRDTEHYEGFYHLIEMEGTVEKAKLVYIVRDHSKEKYEARKTTLKHIEKIINARYGEGTVELIYKEQYCNMVQIINEHPHLVENAKKAIQSQGLQPKETPIRGGTDGARLSYEGLPCPNLSTGGYCYHGPYEHITVEGMDICTNVIVEIVKLYANE